MEPRETQSSALIPRTSAATQRGSKKSKIKLKPPEKIGKKKDETIELQLLVDDTNEMYKVYFNAELFPTLPEYFQYLSEQFNLPHPENFALRHEYPKGTQSSFDLDRYLIRDVSELRDGQSLVLQRNKTKPNNPADLRKRDIKTLIKVSHPTLTPTNAPTSSIFDYLASHAQKEEELVNDNDPLNLNLLR